VARRTRTTIAAEPQSPESACPELKTSPHGLDIDGSTLFVADKKHGLLLFDVRDPAKPLLFANVPNIAGSDVIARAGILFVMADDGPTSTATGPESIDGGKPLSRIPILSTGSHSHRGEHRVSIRVSGFTADSSVAFAWGARER
jgi:hypothetical protein